MYDFLFYGSWKRRGGRKDVSARNGKACSGEAIINTEAGADLPMRDWWLRTLTSIAPIKKASLLTGINVNVFGRLHRLV